MPAASRSELVVLVDEQNRILGTAPKATVHTAHTLLHRGFSLFLFDRNRRVLLQRRALGKLTWPGVWSNSCCGHPTLGEAVEDAARRRARHELGLTVEPWVAVPDFRYRAELAGVVENEICPILVASCDGDPQPLEDEVEEVRWLDWDRFVRQVGEHPGNWSPWSVLEVGRLESTRQFRCWLAELDPGCAVDGPGDVA